MKNVLVVFQATEAKTESLALAFGLGAVEGGANIRLRHLPGSAPATLEHQGYGRVTDGDIEWAEVLGLGIEASEPTKELLSVLEQISAFRKSVNSFKKSAYVFGAAPQMRSIQIAEDLLSQLGFSLVRPGASPTEDLFQTARTAGKYVAAL